MAKYIKIEDAAKAFSIRTPYCYQDCYDDLLSGLLNGIIESEDVAPVVHGIPIRKNRESKEVVYLEAGKENGQILYKRYVYTDKTDWVEYCSVCGKRLCSRFNNYCPNCGAKMDLK